MSFEELVEHGRLHDAVQIKNQGLRRPSKERVREVEEELAVAEKCLRELRSMEGWGKGRGKPHKMQIWHVSKDKTQAFKVHATFDGTPLSFLAILREWDLIPTWNKYVPVAPIVSETLVTVRTGVAAVRGSNV